MFGLNKETKLTREEARQALMQALKDNDTEAFAAAQVALSEAIAAEVREEYDARFAEMREDRDSRILSARGMRQLTSDEKDFYQRLRSASASADPRQALSGSDAAIPTTIIESVFEDLRQNHPLLSRIRFQPSAGKVKVIIGTDGYQTAAWGALNSAIVQAMSAGLQALDVNDNKLSAFIYVPKDALELSPEWLDSYVRECLYEMYANGLEYDIVVGTGKDMPIGMNRDVSPQASVVGGVWPVKNTVAVTDFSPATVGNLLSLISLDGNGKTRAVRDVILLVNSQDYFQKIFPATTIMAPDGTFRRDVLPFPIDVIQCEALDTGKAVLGIAYRYAAVATGAERVDYSDEYQFVEDARTYIVKGFAGGRAKDDNAFLYLDISGVVPFIQNVATVDAKTKSSVNTLAALRVGANTLTPAFAAGTTSYTLAVSTGASEVFFAAPADAGATLLMKKGSTVVDNGDIIEFAAGETVLTCKVTPENGGTTKTYTVTVTAS